MPEDRQQPPGTTGGGAGARTAGVEVDLAELISAWYRVARAQAARRGRTNWVPFPRQELDSRERGQAGR